MKSRVTLAILSLVLVGCQESKPQPADPPPAPAAALPPPAQTQPAENPAIVHVFVLQLAVPFGTVSQNDKFWKLVTEDVVDLRTADILSKNGLRVGRGNIADWGRFRDILDRDNVYSRNATITGISGFGSSPLDMTGQLNGQRIASFSQNGLAVRNYGLSQNLFYFSFQWAPHELDTLRIGVCPTVLALRSRMDYELLDNPDPESKVNNENVYDLALRADILPNQFLVIGPSPTVGDPDTIGYNFLVRPRLSDRLEQLVIVVGKQIDLTKTTQKSYPVEPGSMVNSVPNP